MSSKWSWRGRRADGSASALDAGDGTWSVEAENRLPGSTSWKLTKPAPAGALEGFADRTAVDSGEPFNLHVNTTAATFFVTAYRMGWYGGAQGRRVWQSGAVTGAKQPDAVLDTTTFTVSATAWAPSLTVDTTGWPQGCYLLRLISSAGYDKWVPITVRSPSAAGKVVLVNAVTTWLAYNLWGDFNIYAGPKGSPKDYDRRSRKVTFDRPYDKNGNYFGWYELPMLGLAEKMGLDLAYATDIELHADIERFRGASALIFPGHDEYWSTAMMRNALELRDNGTNLAFFGANTAYRHVRFEESGLGADRVMVCYKSDPDPRADELPEEVTSQWRLDPKQQPESVLTGVCYEGNGIDADMVITEPDAWMFQGTGVRKGDAFTRLIEIEYDKLLEGMPTPRPLQVLAESPVVSRKIPTLTHACYYTVPSGAGVFSSGTLGWTVALPGAARAKRNGPEAAAFVEKTTINILRVFSEGPAGVKHPAKDNYDAYVRPLALAMKYEYDL